MLLELKRHKSDSVCTIGELFINHSPVVFCQTLEDIVRPNGIKIAGKTAIPAGEYLVALDFSQRFNKVMPHIMNVPNFEGIRIHSGNWDTDTDGCILVGHTDSTHPDMVLHSRDTFAKLYPLLESAYGKEVLCISIVDYQEAHNEAYSS